MKDFLQLFCCLVLVVEITARGCDCGVQNRGRIVNGQETGVNQYPSMAGIVDVNERLIFCGATIITNIHAISAAHCLTGRNFGKIILVVGEHDTSNSAESRYTNVYRISAFQKHPNYDPVSGANDISIITTATTMQFNYGVTVACLPFKFTRDTLVNKTVVALGWGAKEFAGPQSNVLLNVFLKIKQSNLCTTKQICSYAPGVDTCQKDSGGPLFYVENNRLFLVGIVSYGVACGTTTPSTNTRVSSYLDWIIKNTLSRSYCRK